MSRRSTEYLAHFRLRPGAGRGFSEPVTRSWNFLISRQRKPIWPENPDVVAVATDEPIKTHLPVPDLNDIDAIAAFVVTTLELENPDALV